MGISISVRRMDSARALVISKAKSARCCQQRRTSETFHHDGKSFTPLRNVRRSKLIIRIVFLAPPYVLPCSMATIISAAPARMYTVRLLGVVAPPTIVWHPHMMRSIWLFGIERCRDGSKPFAIEPAFYYEYRCRH